MSFDAHANFALSAVAVAPSPAGSGTSLTVTAGQGALFPAVPFNATVWPTGSTPTVANAEIVRVTNITGDVLTITRTQESTSARTVLVGDLIGNTTSAKVFTDIEAAVNAPKTIPAQHADIPGSPTTTSAALADIPSSSITVTNTVSCGLLAWLTVELSISAGASATVAVTISINGVDSDETQSFVSTTSGPVSVSKNEASGSTIITPLSPGTYTVKARWRRVSGTGTIQLNSGEITAMFLQVA